MYVCMFLFLVHHWCHCGCPVLSHRKLILLLSFHSGFLELATIFLPSEVQPISLTDRSVVTHN